MYTYVEIGALFLWHHNNVPMLCQKNSNFFDARKW